MKFSLQTGSGINLIQSCTPTEVRVNEQIIRHSTVLMADHVAQWPPATLAQVSAEHLRAVLELAPEVILLGTGAEQRFPDAPLLALVQAANVGIEVMSTPAACRTYNVLVQEGRRVAAALILESGA